jgi:hypothetical protein
MRQALSFALLAWLALALVACKTEVTEGDTQRMRAEFSEENYKKNMYEAGRGAEYEAEKARQASEYQQGGGRDQGQ